MSTARVLGSIVTVQKSNFKANELLNDDNFDFANVSATFKNLERVDIDLRDNLLGIKTVAKIAAWLESGDAPNIVSINLNANEVNNEGAKLLAEASTSPKAPKKLTLNLGSNKITDEGASYWAKTFKHNQNTLTLSLTSNSITEKGAQELELEKNVAPAFFNIDLAGNPLDIVSRLRRA